MTKVVGRGRDQRVLTTREPDLVTRATAIDRLYGLIKERPSEASRIAAMLSLYVREHTVQIGDKIPDVPPVPVPTNATPDELREWAQNLKVARSDLQKAVQTLGRIRNIPKVKLEDNAIYLRRANLQAMDLSGLNFGKGQWQGAQMQGANLRSAQMQEAKLWRAQMQGAAFINVLINEREIYRHTKDVFGDGSNRIDPALFPTGDDAWPDHWSTEELKWDELSRAWRTWVAENHPDVLQYLPDDVRNA